MGIFGPKKVKFTTMGMFTAIVCPCGLSDTGMDYLEPLADEFVQGVAREDQLKCGACGSIFIRPHVKHQGKILGRGRSYEEERLENITREYE